MYKTIFKLYLDDGEEKKTTAIHASLDDLPNEGDIYCFEESIQAGFFGHYKVARVVKVLVGGVAAPKNLNSYPDGSIMLEVDVIQPWPWENYYFDTKRFKKEE